MKTAEERFIEAMCPHFHKTQAILILGLLTAAGLKLVEDRNKPPQS